MGGAQARRLCPGLLVVPPRWPAYVEASRAVFEVFRRTSPLVEGLSIDEAFLDVRGMAPKRRARPLEIATDCGAQVREEVGLPITVGVATTKSLAKIASALAKPDGLLLVPPQEELALLHGLAGGAAVGRRPGHRGPPARPRPRARRARSRGWTRTRWSRLLGPAGGRHLHALAHNRDPRRGALGAAPAVLRRAVGARTPAALARALDVALHRAG